MASNVDYSILAKVVLDLNNIQQQLNNAAKKVTFKVDGKGIRTVTAELDTMSGAANKANEAAGDVEATFNAMNEVFHRSIDVISDMVEQVYTLNGAITEFKKVSNLRGSGLESYVQSLSEIGRTVARTGKPNRSEPE